MKKEYPKRFMAYFLSMIMLLSNVNWSWALSKRQVNTLNTPSNSEPLGAPPANGVNLATGTVTLEQPIASVAGFDLSIVYNSENIQEKASLWNRDQEQGVLGLGWSLPEYKIIRQTHETGTTKDDTYYLNWKGAVFELLFISEDDAKKIKSYRLADKQDWVIKHDYVEDQWLLYLEDGTLYIFGEGKKISHTSNSEEKEVKWENWIGSSIQTEGQSQLTVCYNLSAIENLVGEQVKFYYINATKRIGNNTSGKSCTQACYLSKVEGLRGKVLDFRYKFKESNEYSNPYPEPGPTYAHQTRLQRNYLSEIILYRDFHDSGLTLGRIIFDYKFLQQGTSLQKRLLCAIRYFNKVKNLIAPATVYDYFGLNHSDGVHVGTTKATTKLYNPANGALYGALKLQTLPEGVSYGYQYGKKEVKGSSKKIKIEYPDAPHNEKYDITSKWSAPALFYGSDYVVAIFESQDLTKRESYVRVYHWIGDRWESQDIGRYSGYFYNRYRVKGENKETMVTDIETQVLQKLGPLNTVLTPVNEFFRGEAKTVYEVTKDVSEGSFGRAIASLFSNIRATVKNVSLDVASLVNDEVHTLTTKLGAITGDKAAKFEADQKLLYQARATNIAKYPRKEYHISLQSDFFTLANTFNGHEVVIVQKDKLQLGKWKLNHMSTVITSKFFSIESGDKFVAMLDEITDLLYIYSWDGLIWNTHVAKLQTEFSTNTVGISTSAGATSESNDEVHALVSPESEVSQLKHRTDIAVKNNTILGVITGTQGVNVKVNLLWHDEDMNWTSRTKILNKKETILSNHSKTTTTTTTDFTKYFGKNTKIDVQQGNSFGVLQTYDNLSNAVATVVDIPIIGGIIDQLKPNYNKVNSTFAILWDEDYDNIRLKHLHTGAGQDGITTFVTGDVINKIGKAHSLITGSSGSNGYNNAFRFNGKTFKSKKVKSEYYTSGFSNDVISAITQTGDKNYITPHFYEYDPNTEAWGEIAAVSREKIQSSDYLNQVVNLGSEFSNLGSWLIPELGAAFESEETLETLDIASNTAGRLSYVLGPVTDELANNLIGTNNKSTSVLNTYISVNGKLFLRNSNKTWSLVTNNLFTLQGSTTLVGGTNTVVGNYVPYTVKSTNGIKNYVVTLRNGKVYGNEQNFPNQVVHQDAESMTAGFGAYVSYGPVNTTTGFVEQNAYLNKYRPAATSVLARYRKNRPAYKDATTVTLHKHVEHSFENTLYDYPVSKVSISQGDESLGYHYYEYDGNSAEYHDTFGIAYYGKVTDIPSSKNHAIGTVLNSSHRQGGYTEHYFYNRYNFVGIENRKGYPFSISKALPKLKLAQVSYESPFSDKEGTFSSGINKLSGSPYCTKLYNGSGSLVSSNYINYKVWELVLTDQLTGNILEETRTYAIRPIGNTSILDGVVHKGTTHYENTPFGLVLRSTSKTGTTIDGQNEIHSTRFTYAFEHYRALLKANRLTAPFMTVSSVKQGTESEKVLDVNVIAYEKFKNEKKDVLLESHYYKAKNAKPLNFYKKTNEVIKDIVEEIKKKESKEENYLKDQLTIPKHHNEKLSLLLKEEEKIKDDLHILRTDFVNEVESKTINYLAGLISEKIKEKEVLEKELKEMESELNKRVEEKSAAIKLKETQEKDLKETLSYSCESEYTLGTFILCPLYSNWINKTKNEISELNNGIAVIDKHSEQKRKDYNLIKEKLKYLSNVKEQLESAKNTINENSVLEKDLYAKLNAEIATKIAHSHGVSGTEGRDLKTDKLEAAKSALEALKHAESYQKYRRAVHELVLALNAADLHNNNKFKAWFNKHFPKLTAHTVTHNKHLDDLIRQLNVMLQPYEEVDNGYNFSWVRSGRILSRDKETGQPIVEEGADGIVRSAILNQHNKKVKMNITGLDITQDKPTFFYEDFNGPIISPRFKGLGILSSQYDNYTIENKGIVFSSLRQDPNIQYVIRARVAKFEDSAKIKLGDGKTNVEKSLDSYSWETIEYTLPNNTLPNLSVNGKVKIDYVLIRPVNVIVQANSFDLEGKKISETDNEGNVNHFCYNAKGEKMFSIDENYMVRGHTYNTYSRNHNDTYSNVAPNSVLKIDYNEPCRIYSNAVYEDFYNSGKSYAFSFSEKQLNSYKFDLRTEQVKILKDDTLISVYKKDPTTNLYSQKIAEKTLKKGGKDYLLLGQGGYIQIYAAGQLLAETKDTSRKIRIHQVDAIGDVLFGKDISTKIIYSDGLGRPIQTQYLYNDGNNKVKGKVVKGVLYNGYGNKHILSRPILVENSFFKYDPNFIKYNSATNSLSGNSKRFYEENANMASKTYDLYMVDGFDPSKVFSKIVYSNDILQRKKAFYVTGFSKTSNALSMGYQDTKGDQLRSKIGIAENLKHHFNTTSSGDNHVNTAAIQDVFGRTLGRQKGESISAQKVSYDSGRRKITERLPLSFESGNENKYKNHFEQLDLLGHHSKRTYVDSGEEVVITNDIGLPVFISIGNVKTDPKWRYYKYDTLNRPVASGLVTIPVNMNKSKLSLMANIPLWKDVAIDEQRVWQYDVHQGKSLYRKGRLVVDKQKNGDLWITNTYTYNSKGLVASKTTTTARNGETINDHTKTIAYDYFPNGNLKTIHYPNQVEVSYCYDYNGRLYGVGTLTDPFKYGKYEYGINGKVISKEFSKGAFKSNLKYTLQEYLNEIEVKVKPNDSAGYLTFDKIKLSYHKDSVFYNGAIVKKERQYVRHPKQIMTYKYDEAGQLINTERKESHNYSYDKNGNFHIKNNEKESYKLGTNKLENEPYDYKGNRTEVEVRGFLEKFKIDYNPYFNKVNKIHQLYKFGDHSRAYSVSFVYDANSRRVQKVRKIPGKYEDTLHYVWGNHDLPLYEYFEGGRNTGKDKVYIYGLDYAPIGTLYNGKHYLFLRDHQSSLLQIVESATKTIVEEYEYLPYGQTRRRTHTDELGHDYPIGSYLYTGQEYDLELKLYNFKARFYNPKERVFLQPDPLYLNHSPYTYANNDPVNYVDRDGKQSLWTRITSRLAPKSSARGRNNSYIRRNYEGYIGGNLANMSSSVSYRDYLNASNIDVASHPFEGAQSYMNDINRVVERYVAGRFENINRALRNGGDRLLNGGEMNEVRLLDEYVNYRQNLRVGVLPRERITYRGIPRDPFEGRAPSNSFSFRDKSFMATSRSRQTAREFARHGADTPTFFAIQGRSGVTVPNVQGESEILYPRNTSFNVSRQGRTPDGMRFYLLQERY